MDEIIRKISEIDEKALKIKLETAKILEENEKNLKMRLESLEKKTLERAEVEGQRKYQAIILQGKEQATEIIRRGNQYYNNLEDVFSNDQEELSQRIFNRIINKP